MDVNCQMECVGKNPYVFGRVFFWGRGTAELHLQFRKADCFRLLISTNMLDSLKLT